MKKILLINLLALFLFACEKEETALVAPVRNTGTTVTDTITGDKLIERGVVFAKAVVMNADYSNQIWFDLGTNSVVKTNLRTDWDLSFDCGLNDNYVYLNSALVASIAFTNTTLFTNVTTDAGLTYIYEHQSGRTEKLAIGDVTNQRNVFIIDRGFTPSGTAIGKWKAQITLVQGDDYFLTYSKLDGTEQRSAIISKNPQYNRIAFSFNTNTEMLIEPLKTDYDLVFTQYTHVFENPPQPYSVNGVLLNSHNTEAAEEFNLDFPAITESHAQSLFYSSDSDVIGYSWKSFSLQTNTFTISNNQNFLIKDASSNLFKFRFLDFYDENGVKGTPSFEIVRL